MESPALSPRAAGILLHPTSLPGTGPIGDIGPGARQFVEFLASAGQTWWQMLPIHPVGGGNSPYDSPSAFAGSTLLISLEDLAADGLLDLTKVQDTLGPQPEGRVNFAQARELRPALLREAFANFQSSASEDVKTRYQGFREYNDPWVWDWALFRSMKDRTENRSWLTWPEDLRSRDPDALARAHKELKPDIDYQVFLQFAFHDQWARLRSYARERGVRLMGDLPIYVAHDSVDVWANQQMFFLDESGEKTVQAGVPPDYFSEDGQLWGNPIYRWDVMKQDGYGWWVDRLRRELSKFDAVRLDHFIAFHRYWEVPMGAKTAREGRYMPAPGADFLSAAREQLGGLPLIAEDLGILTPEVEQLRDDLELPGMKILQFAFTPGAEAYLPHRHPERAVAYTGTHDNNTTRGWFDELGARARAGDASARTEAERVHAYCGVESSEQVTWTLIRQLFSSQAHTAIIPAQDALDQDAQQRMNIPGTAEGNWGYRLAPGALTDSIAKRLRDIVEVTERLPERS